MKELLKIRLKERKKKIMEYFNNLPSKNTYIIKYKIKTERIPKKK